MAPLDGNFLDRESKLSRQEKNFRIETPTLDSLQGKDRQHSAPAEGLETALCIFELQSQSNAQKQVEDAPKNLAVQRLALRLQLGFQPARADRNIRSMRNRLQKLGISSMGEDKSASLNTTTRPSACSIPLRTL